MNMCQAKWRGIIGLPIDVVGILGLFLHLLKSATAVVAVTALFSDFEMVCMRKCRVIEVVWIPV